MDGKKRTRGGGADADVAAVRIKQNIVGAVAGDCEIAGERSDGVIESGRSSSGYGQLIKPSIVGNSDVGSGSAV